MSLSPLSARRSVAFTVILALTPIAACRSSEPRSDVDRLARGREIVQHMSETLAAASTFSVTTRELRDEVARSGGTKRVTLTRDTTVRRPDRLYSKVSGDRSNELWYDGDGITLVLHGDKVFGQARAPETLDKTLDAIDERFGVAAPFADYAYSSPAKALLAETTTGGWVARETLDGHPVDHLAFHDTGVNWELWVAAGGQPLPVKAVADFTAHPRVRHTEIAFTNWNLKPQVEETRFVPQVPPDYEGVAILQSARILGAPSPEAGQPAPASPTEPRK
jgi:hypothetical protein